MGTVKLPKQTVKTKKGLDRPFFLWYNMKTMKTKQTIRKARLKINPNETYYVQSLDTKEIDGVTFVYVTKTIGMRETPKLMRKDSLEYVRN